jgi:outer membrane protein W
MMNRRTVVLLCAVAVSVALPLSAQNVAGVWVNSSKLNSTPVIGLGYRVDFDRETGYGLTFNHFSTPNVSTEIGWSRLRGAANVHFPTISPGEDVVAMQAGSLRADMVSALVQWHFMPRAAFSPYIGGGAAYLTRAQITATRAVPPVLLGSEFVTLGDKFTYVANAGVNVPLTRTFSLALDGRYAPYEDRGVQLNPLTVALGLRFRM